MIINDTNNRKARSEKAIVQLYQDYLRDFVSIEKLAQNRDLEPNFLREQLRLRSTMEKLKYKVRFKGLT